MGESRGAPFLDIMGSAHSYLTRFALLGSGDAIW